MICETARPNGGRFFFENGNPRTHFLFGAFVPDAGSLF